MNNFVLKLHDNLVLEDVVSLLDKNGNGILPVIDDDGKLLGIITDGDVRRAIVRKDLNIEGIINRNPFSIRSTASTSQIVSYLKQIRRRNIPLVDENNVFVKVFTLDEIEFNSKDNWVIIMAGGLGSRLGELTKHVPKPMLKVGERPIIEYIIDSFTAHGFSKFILSVNYLSEVIKDYFGDGSKFGITIEYVEETKRLGTGGALSLVPMKMDKPFFVINGDIITFANYGNILDFHNTLGSCATMCVKKDSMQIAYGVIESDSENNIVSMVEKPKKEFYINAGVYVLSPEVLEYIPRN